MPTQQIEAEVRRIHLKYGGHATAEQLLEEATPPHAILHNQFEWDDSAAGHKWRIFQAHSLIHSIKVIVAPREGVTVAIPAYKTLERGQGYLSAHDIQSDAELSRLARLDTIKRVISLLQRDAYFEELLHEAVMLLSRLEAGDRRGEGLRATDGPQASP